MRTAPFFGALALFFMATWAMADGSPEDRAAADKLFNDGVKLAQAGQFVEACPKLEASYKLDPAIGTLLNLGICFEQIGRFASAWTSFNSSADMAALKKDQREADARSRAAAIESKLSMLTVQVPADSDGEGLVIKRDGKVMDRGLWGVAIPVDPGDHVVEATMPGRAPWSTKVSVNKPGPFTASVPKLESQSDPPSKGVATGPTETQPPYVPLWTTGRIVAVSAVGLGLVGLGVGAAFGVDTLSKTGAAKDHCFGGTPLRCDAEGRALHAAAKGTALGADIALIGGGVLLAGGVVLWFVAPGAKAGDRTGRIQVLPGVGGAAVRGEW